MATHTSARRQNGEQNPSIVLKYTVLYTIAGVFVLSGMVGLMYSDEIGKSVINEKMRLAEDSDGLLSFLYPRATTDSNMTLFIFNYTNPSEIVNGAKPELSETGPYVYEVLGEYLDPTINEDGSLLTYAIDEKFKLIPHLSAGDATKSFVYVPDVSFFADIEKMRSASESICKQFNEKLNTDGRTAFVKITIAELFQEYRLFWDMMAPPESVENAEKNKLLIKKNTATNADTYTVSTGHDSMDEFSLIQAWNGKGRFDFWESDICNSFVGSSRGTSFPPNLSKYRTLPILSTAMCRTIPFDFEKEVDVGEIKSYRFTPRGNFLDSAQNECSCPKEKTETDCGIKGVLNVSTCKSGVPLTISWPHFLYGDPQLVDSVKGLHPDPEKHRSFIDIEPTLGKRVRSQVQMQLNLVINRTEECELTRKISTSILPIVWYTKGTDDLQYLAKLEIRNLRLIPYMMGFWFIVIGIAGIWLMIQNSYELYTKVHSD